MSIAALSEIEFPKDHAKWKHLMATWNKNSQT